MVSRQIVGHFIRRKTARSSLYESDTTATPGPTDGEKPKAKRKRKAKATETEPTTGTATPAEGMVFDEQATDALLEEVL